MSSIIGQIAHAMKYDSYCQALVGIKQLVFVDSFRVSSQQREMCKQYMLSDLQAE